MWSSFAPDSPTPHSFLRFMSVDLDKHHVREFKQEFDLRLQKIVVINQTRSVNPEFQSSAALTRQRHRQ